MMEWINSNPGLIVLIGIILNIFFFVFSQRRSLKQFKESQTQSREQFHASQRLTGYIAKKTILEEAPVEYEDAPYPKPKKRTHRTPEEVQIDFLIEGRIGKNRSEEGSLISI